jgi:hypothetical protein
MFLNGRHPADAFVVSIGFIADRYQANDLGFSAFAKDLDPQIPVEQVKAIAIRTNRRRRLCGVAASGERPDGLRSIVAWQVKCCGQPELQLQQ